MYYAATRTLRNLFVKLQHLKKYFNNARQRAKRDKVPFNLTLQDLIDIAADECPILHTPFVWGPSGLGKGKTRPDSPTLDRILPELGYVKGNVAFLSYRANRIKDNGTMQEHYDIADWIWEHTHAKEKSTTPVSTGPDQAGRDDTQSSVIPTTGLRQNRDDADDYRGATQGENSYRSAKEGSGDSVGHRSGEVGAPQAPKNSQDPGHAESTVGSVEEFFERVRSKSRELDLAAGTASKIRQFGD